MAITINGSGTITGVSAGGLPDGSITADDLASTLDISGKTVTLPSDVGGITTGKVLQIVNATKTDTFTTTSTSYVDITGLSASITPSSTSSKILVSVCISTSNSVANWWNHFIVLRGSTTLDIGDSSSNRSSVCMSAAVASYEHTQTKAIELLDSPSTTSSTTYKVQMKVQGQTGTINRCGIDYDNINGRRTVSTITLMEIAG